MTQGSLNQNTLLSTKLKRPRSADVIVSRPRLFELLQRGVALPLTVLSAPPGYGKSTLVGLWLDQANIPWTWYSLDRHDDSLDVFVTYLAAALTVAYPGYGESVASILQNPGPLSASLLADCFVAELDALPGELVFVFDDYHEVTRPEIHAFMNQVIQNAPAGVHIMLLTRSDPPLSLARMRGRRQVLEVRTAQLRFTPDEARQLMQQVMGDLATNEIIALFSERTENWPAGLHLASTSMRDSRDAGAFAKAFANSSSELIVEYLLSEVLDTLSPLERTMLHFTAMLDRFCAPLCDAILPAPIEQPAGYDFLNHLKSSNLFLISLDDEGVWFRFHHLFQDLLRHRLRVSTSKASISALHASASRWFENNFLIEEAIVHALAAGEPERAGRLVEANVDSLLNAENWRTLQHWLGLLPEASKMRPALLVASGWVQQFLYRPSSILMTAQEAEAGLLSNTAGYSSTESKAILSGIHALRALGYLFSGQPENSRKAGQEALALMTVDRDFVRGIAELALIRATALLGQRAEAIELVQSQLRLQIGPPTSRTLRLQLALGATYYDAVDLSQLYTSATIFRHMAEQVGRPVSIAWANFMLGWVHYQRNELGASEALFAEVLKRPYVAHSRAAIDSWIGLSLSLLGQGRREEAQFQAGRLYNYLVEGGQADLTVIADALFQYLNLATGQPVQVGDSYRQRLIGQFGLDIWVLPVCVLVRAMTRSGAPGDLAAAASILAECRGLFASGHMPRRMMEIEIAQTLLGIACRDDGAALSSLRRAVELGEPGGALRFFVDAGPGLKPYLRELANLGVAPTYIQRILTAYTPTLSESPEPPKLIAAMLPDEQSLLAIDMLTNRELDVLALLERRLSNKEIAELLFISPRTVKRHTIAIYQKLQVSNRRAAVAAASSRGLLPTP